MSSAKNNAMPGSAASRQSPDGRTRAILKQREAERVAKLRAEHVTTSPTRRARLAAILRQSPATDGFAQADRMLRALQGGFVTTDEARRYLDVIHPAGRVLSLRRDGHEIVTRWIVQETACGKPHRFAEYSLMPGKAGA